MDKQFEIEKGLPMPTARGSGFMATLRLMEVGDSFSFDAKSRQSVVSMLGRLRPMKFITRNQPDGTCRIWRTA